MATSASPISTLPPGYAIEQPTAQQPSSPTLPPGYTIEGQGQSGPSFGQKVLEGAKQAGSDIYGQIKGAAAAIEPPALRGDFSQGAASILPPVYTQAVGSTQQGIEQLPADYYAYEQARQQGKSPVEAAGIATGVKQAKDQIVSKVKQGIAEFEKNPTQMTTRGLIDAAALAASIWGPDALSALKGGETAEGAETAEAVSKPGILKQVTKGENVVQGPATETVGKTAGAVAKGAEVEAPAKGGLYAFGEAGDSVYAKSKGLYKQIDSATDNQFSATEEKLRKVNNALRGAATDEEAAPYLQQREKLLAHQDELLSQAEAQGVPKETITQAKESYKQANALYDLDHQVHMARVQGGESADTAGRATLVDPKKLLGRLQNMDQSGRLAEAFGGDERAAQKFMGQTAQLAKQGVRAGKIKRIALRSAAAIGGGALAGYGWELTR